MTAVEFKFAPMSIIKNRVTGNKLKVESCVWTADGRFYQFTVSKNLPSQLLYSADEIEYTWDLFDKSESVRSLETSVQNTSV